MSIEAPSKLKKAYCTNCKTDDELSRIFSVNPEAKVCYCPNCMVELKPKDAIDEYEYFIATKLIKADQLLFRDTRFYDAYCAYAHIIEIDPYILKARFGRILSLFYMSTLRKTHFTDAITLLERDAEQFFRKMKDQVHYAKFLNKVLNAIDEYQSRFVRRLTVKERFYSIECVNIYYRRIYEIMQAKKFIINEIDKAAQKSSDVKVVRLLRSRELELSELDVQFHEPVTTADGYRYKVLNVFGPTQILIGRLDDVVPPLSRHKTYKLNENEKKGRLIKDKVYPDNSHLMALATGSIPVMILFFILGAIATLLYFFKWFDLGIIPLFVAGGSIALAITFLILFLIWKHKLSKRRHLID